MHSKTAPVQTVLVEGPSLAPAVTASTLYLALTVKIKEAS